MTVQNTLPTLADLKAQARRLRSSLAADGTPTSHSRALELVARQHGHRDWNTLHAAAGNGKATGVLTLGQRVAGRYLGQPFTGEVIGLNALGDTGRRRVTLRFDSPVDVVTFDSFSSWRHRVTCVVDEAGVTAQKTSNGRPHLELTH